MGFYDNNESGHYRYQKSAKSKVWLTSFISALIGGLLVVLLLPVLSNVGMLPYSIGSKDTIVTSEETMQNTQQASETERISLDVSSDVIDAVEKVSNAIVGVVNIQGGTDFFNRDLENVERGTGSGVVFDKKDGQALIVTNYHVIKNAQTVEISLIDGERVEAELKGADPLTDLAVLAIDEDYVDTVAEFGDSNSIRAGEPAIAIGNPLGLDFSRTVTQGIISAKERSIEVERGWELNVIQTDAAINPGNSGGALINIKGQVIGINSLKISSPANNMGGGPTVEGMGFAIPINDVIPIINSLIEHGEVQRPYMGIQFEDLVNIERYHWEQTLNLPTSIRHGVVITNVERESPAEAGGLEELDVIVEIDDQEITNGIKLRQYLYSRVELGDTIEVKIYREGLPLRIELDMTDVLPSNN